MHKQEALQIEPRVEFGRKVNVFRVSCSCGQFRGCWYKDVHFAWSSHARHVVQQEVR
jgi:hypothetical protein